MAGNSAVEITTGGKRERLFWHLWCSGGGPSGAGRAGRLLVTHNRVDFNVGGAGASDDGGNETEIGHPAGRHSAECRSVLLIDDNAIQPLRARPFWEGRDTLSLQ